MMSQRDCRAVAVAVGLGLALVGAAWAQTPWPVPDSEKGKKSPTADVLVTFGVTIALF